MSKAFKKTINTIVLYSLSFVEATLLVLLALLKFNYEHYRTY